jgi:hypothetical protein
LSSDPLGLAGGGNLYTYGAGDPMFFIDPLGLTEAGENGGKLWFDRLGNWSRNTVNSAYPYLAENLPWQIGGVLSTILEIGNGILSTPQAIGHLGEAEARYWDNPTPENLAAVYGDISLTASIIGAGISALPSVNNPIGMAAKPLLSDEAWGKNAPKQVTPGTNPIEHYKYNPKTGQLEKSVVEYDQYGRQINRTDISDHGYPQDHTVPHTHEYEYNQEFPFGHEVPQ